MVKIKTDDIDTLKDVCEFLAYKVVQMENPNQYCCSDEQVATVLRCDGLEVEIE